MASSTPAPRNITIALDGYAGCGKSTTAKRVAAELGYVFLDTGSMYRAFTLHLQRLAISHKDTAGVQQALESAHISFTLDDAGRRTTLLNGQDVEREIRSLTVSNQVSEVAAIGAVRRQLVRQQQQLGQGGRMVMDGRDIGTVVFPHAELKVFMTASLEARVQRRKLELATSGQSVDEAELTANLLHRDEIDTTRAESPLRRAPDARLLDTTHLTIDDQVTQVLAWARELISAPVAG